MVTEYLDKLEALIDLNHVKRTRDLQRRAFAFEEVDHIPTMIVCPAPEDEWPAFSHLEIYSDPQKMLLSELASAYMGAKIKDDRLYGIRANYGTGIIASMFGCEVVTFEDTLPIALHIGRDDIDRILGFGVPDIRSGDMSRVLDTAAYFREALRPYPKLSQAIGSQIFDIQGPFDNASIIWGSEIFLAVYDEPEKIRDLMDIITQTISATVSELRRIDGCSLDEHDGQWNFLGGLCVRNDSSVNLSGNQYEELVRPFDARLLQSDGGWVHFCGRAHQWWERLLNIPGIRGINPYQGEFYDLCDMYSKCEASRVPIVQWTRPLDSCSRERIRTGFSRILWKNSFDDACSALERLHATGHADDLE